MIGDLTYRVDSWSYSLGAGHTIDDGAAFGSIEILVSTMTRH